MIIYIVDKGDVWPHVLLEWSKMRGRTNNDGCNYWRGGETVRFVLEGIERRMTLVCVSEALIVAIKACSVCLSLCHICHIIHLLLRKPSEHIRSVGKKVPLPFRTHHVL